MEGHHPAIEEYTEAIFELEEDNVDVIQARIAERLEVSRPAVSEMIQRLVREGVVTVDDDGMVRLTSDGTRVAERTVRRHRLAERFLTDVLGLSWTDAHAEAGQWEHVISPTVEVAMVRLLDDPTTCPHGNPIPGSDYIEHETLALVDIPVGAEFVVDRIPEELEFAPGVLQFLESSSVMPGERGKVIAASPDGTVTVELEGHAVGIGEFASRRISVSKL